MSFYEPTLLFRQNAIKKFQTSLSPIASQSSLELGDEDFYQQHNNSSWLLNQNNPKDTEIINKSCSLNRLHIKSNYWKIPDSDKNLTSLAISSHETDNAILAVSSAKKECNLFIYELDLINNYLTHHNTISLPNIHSMKWVPNTNSKYLVTGNNKGYAHLVSLPPVDKEEDEEESAEIVKRFNHRKHLKSINQSSSILKHKHTNITEIGFHNNNRLLSIYDNNLFYWDMKSCESQIRPKPLVISNINGVRSFDTNTHSDNIIGICGKFGVSLLDIRNPRFSVPDEVINQANKQNLSANKMKWSPTNDYVFAAGHMDGVVRLWDVRKQNSFAELDGHQGRRIMSLQWNGQDLFSGGYDGNIVHWDLTSDVTNFTEDTTLKQCGLKEGINSVKFCPSRNSMDKTIRERQCGTVLPASNTKIMGMESIKGSDSEDLKILSIDSSSFFGIHSKIYDAINININTNKLYYTDEDIRLLMNSQENSDATLVSDSAESLLEYTKPLAISRKPTIKEVLLMDDSEPALMDDSEPALYGLVEPNTPVRSLIVSSSPVSVPELESPSTNDTHSLDDFSFSMPRLDSSIFNHMNESSYSVDSQVHIKDDSGSGEEFNDSMDTLSTNPTMVESIEHNPKLNLLDLNLNDDNDFTFANDFSNFVI